MRTLALALVKDLRRWLRSPLPILVFLLFPVVFSLLIGLTFGGAGGGETLAPIRIALVDHDGGLVARLLRSSFEQEAGPVRFESETLDEAVARERIEGDKVSAVVTIPKGFEDSLLSGRASRLEILKNPAESIYPSIVEEYVKTIALILGSASRILAEPLASIRDATLQPSGPTDLLVSDISVQINQRMPAIERYALPPAIRIVRPAAAADTVQDAGGSSPLRVAAFVLPGIASFALLTLALAMMADLKREEAERTLARQLTAPVSAWGPVGGKVAATALLALVCTILLVLVASIGGGLRFALVPFLLLSIAFALAATGFATLVHAFSGGERAGAVVGGVIVMVMSMIGGSWVPIDSLPAAVRAISPFTLNYWANDGYRKVLFDASGTGGIALHLGVLALLAFVLLAAAVLRLRQRLGKGV